MSGRLLTALVAMAVATTALAQDTAADWDATDDPARKLTAASSSFSNGLSIAFRCMDNRYDALIVGLPLATGESQTRTIGMQFGEKPMQDARWNIGSNASVLVSDLPARLAREFRDGGPLQLVARGAGDGGANLRYVIELPASGAQIDRTLEACARPIVDPRDAEIADLGENGLPGGFSWANAPEPSYPRGPTYERGFATVSCLNQTDGRLRDCVVESEHPLNGGFGEAALRATRRARVQSIADPRASLPTRMIIYRTNFRMRTAGEEAVRPLGSRLARD
jgi:hypothetical protein